MNKARRERKKARKLAPAGQASQPAGRQDVTVTAGTASASGVTEIQPPDSED